MELTLLSNIVCFLSTGIDFHLGILLCCSLPETPTPIPVTTLAFISFSLSLTHFPGVYFDNSQLSLPVCRLTSCLLAPLIHGKEAPVEPACPLVWITQCRVRQQLIKWSHPVQKLMSKLPPFILGLLVLLHSY